ncbi:hypothetical protein DB32_004383 [Sandaracinus amylolyticus]|uniref:Uncharacterized protein n=1 Tax=Sandaracinus amylolyticus TaxID=927083 RepID=A0A0F6SFN1_9BACT|nr:hypothetical protein DB32_004383 [Sandaracinus amylolyticus]
MIACAAALPARASAADAIVLSIGGDAPDATAREARDAVIAALSGDGVVVVPEAEIALRVPPARLRAMTSLADARALAFELEARTIVGVAVWMRAEGDAQVADSVVVSALAGSRSYSATRSIGEPGLAAAATEATRDVRQQQTRAVLIEGAGIDGASRAEPETSTSPTATTDVDVAAGRAGGDVQGDTTPGFDFIGPTMLAAFGAAGIGLGVYALLDGTCENRAPSGTCLRGEDPNVPVGVTLTVAGILALGGGVVWFVTGAFVTDTARIDVVLGPGNVGLRGQF